LLIAIHILTVIVVNTYKRFAHLKPKIKFEKLSFAKL